VTSYTVLYTSKMFQKLLENAILLRFKFFFRLLVFLEALKFL